MKKILSLCLLSMLMFLIAGTGCSKAPSTQQAKPFVGQWNRVSVGRVKLSVPVPTSFNEDGSFSENQYVGNWTEQNGTLLMTYTSLRRGRPIRPREFSWSVSKDGKQLTLKHRVSSLLHVYERA
jgi:hypothetical protein